MLLIALSLTIVIEFFGYVFLTKDKLLNLFFYSVLINSTTWPGALYFYNNGFNILLVEMIVFIIEIILILNLFKIKLQKAIMISFIANLTTTLTGIIFF